MEKEVKPWRLYGLALKSFPISSALDSSKIAGLSQDFNDCQPTWITRADESS
jgi:hypothetical protein